MARRHQVTLEEVLREKGLAPPPPEDPLGLVMCPGITPPGSVIGYTIPQPADLAKLHFEFGELPPSTNNLYFNNRWGGRTKTDEAKAYANRFMQALRCRLADISAFIEDRAIYAVWITAYFPRSELLSETYGMKGGAKERYKKLDASNRVKFLEDCLSKALGLDDKLFFRSGTDKKCADLVGGRPQVHIDLEKVDAAFFGV